jgi:vancomycin permeability regulator SanA
MGTSGRPKSTAMPDDNLGTLGGSRTPRDGLAQAKPALPHAIAGTPRRRWWRWLAAVVALAVAYVVAANAYVIGAARAATLPDIGAAPVRPYAIVLGNTVSPEGIPCPDLESRLETARALYAAGRVHKVIASGGVVRKRNYDEPHAMAAWLVARGVKPEDVIVDEGGHRTAATMADAAALGVRSALIVTQAYHLPRSIYLARHADIDVLGVAAPPRRWDAGDWAKVLIRETSARAEVVLEVAVRGVR